MRVLWFTNTPSLYRQNTNAYNGGGWIESLERYIRDIADINLGVSFFHADSLFKIEQENVTYYPICIKRNVFKKIAEKINPLQREKKDIADFLRVINDFKPDIIHIFGSENSFGLVAKHTSVPVVLHVQGIVYAYAYAYAYYPPSYSNWEMPLLLRFNPLKLFFHYKAYYDFCQYAASREKRIFSCVKNYMGRTKWDKEVISILSPKAKYYYCGEMLRTPFYESKGKQRYGHKDTFTIVSTISQPLYKGFDLILKTAAILSEDNCFQFEWQVFGNVDTKIVERKLNITPVGVHVFTKGVVSAEYLADTISDADVFMHPSYIDNSPNSVCEAQMLGIPVISTNVGGISSLIDNMVDGILIPANDPFIAASSILLFFKNPRLAEEIGTKGRETALQRHDKKIIINDVLRIYNAVLSESSG